MDQHWIDIEQVFRGESGRILATLIGLLGSFDLAEEAMQEAFAVALELHERQPGIHERGHAGLRLVHVRQKQVGEKCRDSAAFEQIDDPEQH